MKILVRSFLLTFFIVMGIGSIFIVKAIRSETQISKSVKENTKKDTERKVPHGEDSLNLLQLVKIREQKFLLYDKINPMTREITVKNIPLNQKVEYHSKEYTIEGLYNYAGIKSVKKVLKEQLSVSVDRYMIMEDENALEFVLDCVGTIEYQTKKLPQLEIGRSEQIYTDGYQLIDFYKFIKIIDGLKYEPDKQVQALEILTKEFFLQKAQLLKSDLSENLLKEVTNNIQTDISFSDFYKIKSIFAHLTQM